MSYDYAKIEEVPAYPLLLELFCAGDAGLIPKLEPLLLDCIVDALTKLSGEEFGVDSDRWAEWFLEDEIQSSPTERENFRIFLESIDALDRIEAKFLRRYFPDE